MSNFSIDITPLIQAILAFLAALITYRLIPLIQSKTTASQQSYIEAMVRSLAFAAEQIFGAGEGKAKMAWVKDKLGEKGYEIDDAQIEAVVGEYINKLKGEPTIAIYPAEAMAEEIEAVREEREATQNEPEKTEEKDLAFLPETEE